MFIIIIIIIITSMSRARTYPFLFASIVLDFELVATLILVKKCCKPSKTRGKMSG